MDRRLTGPHADPLTAGPATTGPETTGPETTGSAATGPASAAEALIARFNLAWSRHDLAAALALISEDCVFESTSPAPDGQRSVGKAAIRAAWQPIFDDASSQFTVEEFFTAGRRVVQRWRYDWDGGYVRGVDVMTVAGGLVTAKLSYVKG
jgi:ketosteroid isomerase-like protein